MKPAHLLSEAPKAVKSHPKIITAQEFLEMIAENPSVFEHWNTPLEITGVVNCIRSNITHLSPSLTFSGFNKDGNTAYFTHCPNLKVATGTFHGCVYFSNSSIEKIENLKIKNANYGDTAASFEDCKTLQIATGSYPSYVNFSGSGIQSIQNLSIQKPDQISKEFATFFNCPNLKTLEGWDLSKKISIEPEKLEAEAKKRKSLKKFHKESQAPELPFL
jgi:hypothetical protein